MLETLPNAWEVEKVSVILEGLVELERRSALKILGCDRWEGLVEGERVLEH